MDRRHRDGIYDRGQDRGQRFGRLVDGWLREPDCQPARQLAAKMTQELGRTYYPSELRRVADGKVGVLHLSPRTIEAYLRAFGKTDTEDRARAYRAAGVVPEDMTEAGLLLGMIASKRKKAS